MIFSTVSQKRTHIAQDTHYLGSVNSYNNFLTKFVAKLFRKGIDIDFSGKKRTLNRKSYQKHLQQLGITDKRVQECLSYTSLITPLPPCQLPRLGYLRDHIHHKKRNKQFNKLIHALAGKDEQKAKKAICKGAEVNQYFYLEGNRASTEHPRHRLNRSEGSISFIEATPLIAAVQNNTSSVADLLAQAGANLHAVGNKTEIHRHLQSIEQDTSLHHGHRVIYTPTYHHHRRPHHHRHRHPHHRRPHVHYQPHVVSTPYVEKRTYKVIQEREQEIETYTLQGRPEILRQVSKKDPSTKQYRRLSDVYRRRAFLWF